MKSFEYHILNFSNVNNGVSNYTSSSIKLLQEAGIDAFGFNPKMSFGPTMQPSDIMSWLAEKNCPTTVFELPDIGGHLLGDLTGLNIHMRLHASKDLLFEITRNPSRGFSIKPTRRIMAQSKMFSSPTLANLYAYRYLPQPINRISVFPNPVVTTIEENLHEKDIDVVFIGRFDLIKGADYLRQLLFYLPKNTVVRAIGVKHESFFSHPWINERLDFDQLGWLDNSSVSDLLSRTKVVVLLSRTESFSYVAMEALANKCNLCTWDIPTFTELLPSALNQSVELGNIYALAKLICRQIHAPPPDDSFTKSYFEDINRKYVNGVKNILWSNNTGLMVPLGNGNKMNCCQHFTMEYDPEIHATFFARHKPRIYGLSQFNNHIEEIWHPLVARLTDGFKFISARSYGNIRYGWKVWPIDEMKCVSWKWPDDLMLLYKDIKEFAPEMIFIFNGNTPLLQRVSKHLVENLGIPVVYFELGWFPQKNHVYCDLEGAGHKSSIARKTLEQLLGKPVPPRIVRRKFQHNRALLVLQKPGDTTISEGPFPRQCSHTELINYVRESIPNNIALIVRRHPKDDGEYNIDLPNTFADSASLEESLMNVDAVIGVNSTALLEAMRYSVNVYHLGHGVMGNKGVAIDCIIDGLAKKWQPFIEFDQNRRESFLAYLESIQINIETVPVKELSQIPGLKPIFDAVSIGPMASFFPKKKKKKKERMIGFWGKIFVTGKTLYKKAKQILSMK